MQVYSRKSYSFDEIKELNKTESNQYSKYTKLLHSYESIKRLFQIMISNNNDLIKFIEEEKKTVYDEISVNGNKERYYNHHLQINRYFLNYLGSYRTLLDHTETLFKKTMNDDEINSLKTKTSILFDNYFSYRFFTKLRNFSQHCGIPIDDFKVSLTLIKEPNTFKTEYEIDFISSELLDKYDSWGKILKEDLKNKTSFSLFPLLDEFEVAMNEFWEFILSFFKNKAKSGIDFITTQTDKYKNENNEICIFSDITYEGDRIKYFTSNVIPYDIIRELK